MSFWDVFWNTVIAFFFIAYLLLLFQIFADLFRDDSMGGWAKAVWVFFLIVAPFITALVYVIARGGSMAARSEQRAQRAAADTDDYIRRVAGKPTPAEQIVSARTLLDEGRIDESEFQQLKTAALS